jgi:hypothetical protein
MLIYFLNVVCLKKLHKVIQKRKKTTEVRLHSDCNHIYLVSSLSEYRGNKRKCVIIVKERSV